MAPKKQRTGHGSQDIRSFLEKENNTPRSSTPRRLLKNGPAFQTPTRTPLREKDENGGNPDEHSHHFTVKRDPSARKEFTVHCNKSGTIMEAIRSNLNISKEIEKCADENMIIQLGKEDKDSIVASHFPCCCVDNGESVILWSKSEVVEKVQAKDPNDTILPKDSYSIFYIDKEGGLNTRTKELFRSKAVKKFKFLCVYAKKGMTVAEALENDGRFIDDLGEFTLSDNDNPDRLTERTQRVDSLHQKAFKICLPLKKRGSGGKPSRAILELAHVRGTSVNKAIEEPGASVEQVYELLRKQFPGLKEWMESRFPGDSYQKELKLRELKFKKIQRLFNQVHRTKRLHEVGKGVCKLVVENVCSGTGFVLFDRLVLTNAHLFKDCVEGKRLKEVVDVFALFNYEEEEPKANYFYFSAEKTLVDIDFELDYAVLQLNPEGHKSSQQARAENIKVPPGLLKKIGPLPKSGEACILGHPGGSVKTMDPTCIIEAEEREQALKDQLAPHKRNMFIVQTLINQGIEDIMVGGRKADKVATYKSLMYHGSSGSPVFDAQCQVFGLHTAGYGYGLLGHEESMIEYANPMLTIVEMIVSNLRAAGNTQLLERLEEEAKENLYIRKILQAEPADPEELMDLS